LRPRHDTPQADPDDASRTTTHLAVTVTNASSELNHHRLEAGGFDSRLQARLRLFQRRLETRLATSANSTYLADSNVLELGDSSAISTWQVAREIAHYRAAPGPIAHQPDARAREGSVSDGSRDATLACAF
jgi:hypothetical protein